MRGNIAPYRRMSDKDITDAPPDGFKVKFLENSPRDRLDVEVAMTFHHFGERVTEVHHVRDDPAIDARNP